MRKILDFRYQILEGERQPLGITAGTTEGINMGKQIIQLWESGVIRVVHIIAELYTKLSTKFSTAIAEFCSTIHRLYYYNYFI